MSAPGQSEQQTVAIKTLEFLGYTYHGGEQWKPPLGKKPAWLDDPAPAQQGQCLCKDKCLHAGAIDQCKGLPSVLAAPVQRIPESIICPFCESEHVPGWLHDMKMDIKEQ